MSARLTPSLVRLLKWAANRYRDKGQFHPAALCRSASEACEWALQEIERLEAKITKMQGGGNSRNH